MRRTCLQFLGLLALVVLAAVAFAVGSAAGQSARAASPGLAIEASVRAPKQGSVVALSIRSDHPLTSLALEQAGRALPVDGDGTGTLFRALVGIDLDAPTGDLRLRITPVPVTGVSASIAYALRVVSGRFAVQRLKVRAGYVDLSPELLERVRADQAAVREVWASGEPVRRWRGPFLRPVEAEPADNFGVRRIFNGQPRAPHNGVDFRAPEGTPVVAPAEARVAMAADLYFSGRTIILDHGAGLFTTYFHLSRIEVAAGEIVGPGRVIGAVGSTGRSTGPHLHWGARLHGARVNPLDLLALPDWRT